MEATAIMAVEMDNMVHRVNDIIDRYDVEFATFYPNQWYPGRQDLAQFLQALEEIVGAVNFVDLTGLAVATTMAGR